MGCSMGARSNNQSITGDRRGATLLLALIIVAAVIAAGIGASVIVVREFQIASSVDKGMAAYYAADTGIERALFTVYNNRVAGTPLGYSSCADGACFQVRNNLPLMTSQPSAVSGEQFNMYATRYDRKSATVSIKQNQSAQLELSFGSGFSGASAARTLFFSPATSINVKNDPSDEETLIEVQWVYLMRASLVKDIQPENSTIRLVSKKNVRYGFMIDLFTGTIISADDAYTIVPSNPTGVTNIPSDYNMTNISGWIVTIKALTSDVGNLTAYACTGTDICTETAPERYTMYSSLSIASRGSAGGAQQTLYARVPLLTPATGVFDYALFSEETIEKPD